MIHLGTRAPRTSAAGPPGTARITRATAPAPNRAVSSSRHTARLLASEARAVFPRPGLQVGPLRELMAHARRRVVPVLRPVLPDRGGVPALDRRPPPGGGLDHGGRDPAISRTGSRPPAVSGRAVNVSPSAAARWTSNAVLWASDAANVIRCRPRASRDRRFPSVPRAFDDTAAWVCRFGSPARVPVLERRRGHPVRLGLRDPPGPRPGVRRMLLHQAEGLAQGRLVRAPDRVPHPVPLVDRPHSAADFTGENTRSNPATAARRRRASWLRTLFSSASVGSRPACSLIAASRRRTR